MIELCQRSQCTSCLACYNACRTGAIKIEENQLAERIPVIDTSKCVECGRCIQSCPILNPPSVSKAEQAVALYSKDLFERSTCSSGGVATTLSKEVITDGGTVFGATMHSGKACFISVNDLDQVNLLKGSKYVYCSPGLIYREIKGILDTGRLCLFIGMPCQVAGVRSFLGKEYENLITIDLICHGTPPFTYLKQHITKLVNDYSSVDRATFRGKNDFTLCIYSKCNQLLYAKDQTTDYYYSSFMSGVIYREVCYKCRYANEKRISDITIGDFWGLDNAALNGYKGKKSVALPNTYKGKKFLENNLDLFEYEIRDIQEAIDGNDQLREPSSRTVARDKFVESYTRHHDFETAMRASGISKKVFYRKARNFLLYVPKKIRNIISTN